jgi:hypothetical protein
MARVTSTNALTRADVTTAVKPRYWIVPPLPGALLLASIGVFVARFTTDHPGSLLALASMAVNLGTCGTVMLEARVLHPRARRRFDEVRAIAEHARQAGDLDESERLYLALARRLRLRGALHIEALSYVASVKRQRGDLDGAIETWLELDARVMAKATPGLKRDIALSLADTFAERGNVVAARTWLDDARARPGEGSKLEPFAVEATLLVREGHFERALAVLAYAAAGLARTRAEHADMTLRRLAALRAFVLERRGHAEREIEAEVTNAMPCFPGEHRSLAVAWHAMAAFLRSRGLLDDTATRQLHAPTDRSA